VPVEGVPPDTRLKALVPLRVDQPGLVAVSKAKVKMSGGGGGGAGGGRDGGGGGTRGPFAGTCGGAAGGGDGGSTGGGGCTGGGEGGFGGRAGGGGGDGCRTCTSARLSVRDEPGNRTVT
jgi:hypothetical protein